MVIQRLLTVPKNPRARNLPATLKLLLYTLISSMCLKGSNGFSQTLLRMLGHPLSTTRKYPNVLNANGWELFNSLADRKFEGNFIPFGHFLGQPIQARTILPPSLPPSNGFPSAILLVFFFFSLEGAGEVEGEVL